MSPRALLRNGAQLAGLWALAVAQPLFEATKSGEAFVLAGWRGGDLLLFALGTTLLPPTLMLLSEIAIARFGRRPARALHLVFVGAIGCVLTSYILEQSSSLRTELSLPLALVAGAGLSYLVGRLEIARSFVTVLSPAAILVPALFLLASPTSNLILPASGSDLTGEHPSAPVVMIVFDEFPSLSLMDARGRLDRRSFPSFASLARDGTWFRNATTVADFTPFAVPAILTGRYQDGSRPPSLSGHPDNLLALFGQRGKVEAWETLTRLCPAEVCHANQPQELPERFTDALPSLGKISLATFLPDGIYRHLPAINPFPPVQPEEAVEAFARSVRSKRASLYYLHVETPHQPWGRLPSGRTYPGGEGPLVDFVPELPDVFAETGIPSFPTERWVGDPARVAHMRQRHLAQSRYADRLLGRALRALRSTELYDRALVVVTADHSVAFEPGHDARRLSRATAPGVLGIPLFLKRPDQRLGTTSERFVQSIDIAPTVAEVVGFDLPWRADGRSALGRSPDRTRLAARAIETHETLEFDAADLQERLKAAAVAQAELFAGRGPERIFRSGVYGRLIGQRATNFVAGPQTNGVRCVWDAPGRRLWIKPRSEVVPALVSGRLTGAGSSGRDLAVVLDGRVVATATSHPSRSPGARFEALVAERLLPAGTHNLRLYALSGSPTRPTLSPVLAGGR